MLVERPGCISFCEWKGHAINLNLELEGNHMAIASRSRAGVSFRTGKEQWREG